MDAPSQTPQSLCLAIVCSSLFLQNSLAVLLFIRGAPGRVLVKRCHCTRKSRSVSAKVLLIDNIPIRDDESHHTRRPILCRVSNQGESARRLALSWARRQ